MNPQNLLADAERLRIVGTHDPLSSVITWSVQTGGPPGSLWEPLLAFDAPIGDDPETARAIPEGLECLVTTAASFYGLNVHVEPVRSMPSRVAELGRKVDATMQGAKAAHVEDFRELTRRLNTTLDALILPPGEEAESVPAPRCEHNFLTPHTVTSGGIESGFIERKCLGGTDPGYHVDAHREGDELHVDIACRVPPRIDGPIEIHLTDRGTKDAQPGWPYGSPPHAAWMRSMGLCAASTVTNDTGRRHVCDVKAEDHDQHPLHGDTVTGHKWPVVPCMYCGDPREWPASQAKCRHPLLHAPEPPEDEAPSDVPADVCRHGRTGPHGTDALDRGPTCPGPNAAFRYEGDQVRVIPTCEHGRTINHVVSTATGVSWCDDGPTTPELRDPPDTSWVTTTRGPRHTEPETIKRGRCPFHDVPLDDDGRCRADIHTQGHLDRPRQPGSPPASEEGADVQPWTCLAYVGLGDDGPVRCTQPVPCPAHDPSGRWVRKVDADPPTCSVCDRPIMVVPGAGFGVGASWQHRDGSKGHEAKPNLVIDPMPEACRRFHPGERCRPGDNHPAAATPTSAGST